MKDSHKWMLASAGVAFGVLVGMVAYNLVNTHLLSKLAAKGGKGGSVASIPAPAPAKTA